jgi:hypothetical protein
MCDHLALLIVGALFGAAIIYVLLIRKDHFDEYAARRREKPRCFGTYPFLNGQELAERDCGDCSFANACHEDSPHPRRPK